MIRASARRVASLGINQTGCLNTLEAISARRVHNQGFRCLPRPSIVVSPAVKYVIAVSGCYAHICQLRRSPDAGDSVELVV